MTHDKRAARLVLTHSRRMWHIAKPETPYYALCGSSSRPSESDYPVYSDVCKRCQGAYDREGASTDAV